MCGAGTGRKHGSAAGPSRAEVCAISVKGLALNAVSNTKRRVMPHAATDSAAGMHGYDVDVSVAA